jgi:hypothetical protein
MQDVHDGYEVSISKRRFHPIFEIKVSTNFQTAAKPDGHGLHQPENATNVRRSRLTQLRFQWQADNH